MKLIHISKRPTIPSAFAACVVMFVLLVTGVRAPATSSGESKNGKTACADSSGKTVSGKECEKAGAEGKAASGPKTAPGAAKSPNKESAATSAEKDKLSGEHMSTRGLKPPSKDTDKGKQQKKADDAPKQ